MLTYEWENKHTAVLAYLRIICGWSTSNIENVINFEDGDGEEEEKEEEKESESERKEQKKENFKKEKEQDQEEQVPIKH